MLVTLLEACLNRTVERLHHLLHVIWILEDLSAYRSVESQGRMNIIF